MDVSIRIKVRNGIALLQTILVWIWSPPLLAQSSELTVTIVSPSGGAAITDAVAVRADVGGSSQAAGVQFKLNGVNLGEEDTSLPYAIAWNTQCTPNGTYTLTAVGRTASGQTATSAPVTVNVRNDLIPPTVVIMSPAAGAVAGGMVAVYAEADDDTEVAGVQFMLDGASLGTEDTAAPYSITWNTEASSDGTHTLTALARDAVGRTSYSAPVNVTVANKPPSMTRVEETDARVSFSGAWVHENASYPWSANTASYTRGPGARVNFNFIGTRVRWIGWREARGGIARVYLDGVLAGEVDLYSSTIAVQVPVFTSEVLSPGSHTLSIEAIGTGNPAATDTIVVADAFETASAEPPPPDTMTRIEETDPAVVWSYNWIADSLYGPWSGGSAKYNVDPGAYASFTFSGTGVSWIGYRGRYGGIVKVYVDGALTAELDTYTPEEEIAVPVYTITGLAAGTHSLLIELTGLKNTAAVNSETAVDAFDVLP